MAYACVHVHQLCVPPCIQLCTHLQLYVQERPAYLLLSGLWCCQPLQPGYVRPLPFRPLLLSVTYLSPGRFDGFWKSHEDAGALSRAL